MLTTPNKSLKAPNAIFLFCVVNLKVIDPEASCVRSTSLFRWPITSFLCSSWSICFNTWCFQILFSKHLKSLFSLCSRSAVPTSLISFLIRGRAHECSLRVQAMRIRCVLDARSLLGSSWLAVEEKLIALLWFPSAPAPLNKVFNRRFFSWNKWKRCNERAKRRST